MGVPKKSVTPRQKSKAQMKPTPAKAFEMEDFDDDDDDFSEPDSDASDKPTPAKKTSNLNTATPALTKSGKKSVSFQVQQGKGTPMGQKTPKGANVTPKGNQRPAIKGTPMPGKKTPGAMQANNSGKKSSLKEFSGMDNVFGGKIETLKSPIKGKIHPAAKKFLKRKTGNEEDDDEDSDDFEDDMEDSDEQDSDDEVDDDDIDEEDDSGDDDDIDEEDDGNDLDEESGDDSELDSEEEKELRKQILAMKGKSPKAAKGGKIVAEAVKKTPKSGEESQVKQERAQKTPKGNKDSQAIQKTPKTKNLNEAKDTASKSKLKKEADAAKQSSPQKSVQIDPEEMSLEQKRRHERDLRNLFVRNIPKDVPVSELKALSPDILDVYLPKPRFQKKHLKSNQAYYAFLEFANEAKAEENYEILKNKKLRGAPFFVDYAGSKSKNRSIDTNSAIEYNKKSLFVTGLSTDTTILQLAQLFPKAKEISMNNAPEFRVASVHYTNEEDAAEAFKSNSGVKLNGRPISVLHSSAKNAKKRSNKNKRKKPQKKPTQNKKMKVGNEAQKVKDEVQKAKEESEEEDDDDDDDSDEDEE